MALGRLNTSPVSYGLNNKLCHNDLLEFYHRNSPKSYHWKLEECLVLGQETIALKVSLQILYIYIYIYIYINIGSRKKTTLFFLLPIFISRSTLTYRALYYGKIETQTSYIYIYINIYIYIYVYWGSGQAVSKN